MGLISRRANKQFMPHRISDFHTASVFNISPGGSPFSDQRRGPGGPTGEDSSPFLSNRGNRFTQHAGCTDGVCESSLDGLSIPSILWPQQQSKLSSDQTVNTVKTFGNSMNSVPNDMPHTVKKNKVLNIAISKNRKLNLFQTVNHSRIIWDPKSKPRGILGGHLNIRSFKSKSDQIHQLLLDSNLDFLCLSETWLNENSPLSILHVPG